MKAVTNSFSLQMLTAPNVNVAINEISPEKFQALSYDAISFVGNPDLANLLHIPYNRETLKLRENDVLLVAQICGGILPEGATSLPHNVTIRYYCVQIIKSNTMLLGQEKIKIEEE